MANALYRVQTQARTYSRVNSPEHLRQLRRTFQDWSPTERVWAFCPTCSRWERLRLCALVAEFQPEIVD